MIMDCDISCELYVFFIVSKHVGKSHFEHEKTKINKITDKLDGSTEENVCAVTHTHTFHCRIHL